MRFALSIVFLFLVICAPAQKSPFNGLTIPDSIGNNYSFLVSGHFHGSSANISGFPASSLLANLDVVNTSGNLFLASTGDLFLDVTKNIPTYKRSFFSKLTIPMYNAVGNHDLSGEIYQQNFGNTWFNFSIGQQAFVFLDTEHNDGSIKGEQYDFLKKLLDDIAATASAKQVFIFSHRPVWSEGNEALKNVFKENTQSDFGNNFNADILPLLKKISAKTAVYWFSGSLGGDAPASFFYYKESPGVFYIQSAIRDLPRDGMLQVNVSNNQVSFNTISLSGQKMPVFENCDLTMWQNESGAPGFNYRLVPLYIKQMIFHRYFWYGIGYSLLAYTMIYLFLRRRKRRKNA